jgi:hypothetical protein
MKKVLGFFCFWVFGQFAFGQTLLTNLGLGQSITLVEFGSSSTNVSVQVGSNQVLEIEGFQLGAAGSISLTVTNLPGQDLAVVGTTYSSPLSYLPEPLKFAGPLTVNFTWTGSSQQGAFAWATCKLIGNGPFLSAGSSITSVPSTAVVIPADAAGPVQIVLESSQDLVNWVPALPGTYGASTTNRFFRVRAILQ